jgi:hypothetical protein
MQASRHTRYGLWITALTFAGCLSGGQAEADMPEKELLVVDGAQNVRNVRMSDTHTQTSYSIELTYPLRAVGAWYWGALRSAGWTQCRYRNAGVNEADSDWTSVIDATSAPESILHQQTSYWFKDDQLITILMRYQSFDLSAETAPDNTHQMVYLLFDEKHGREAAAWLDLDCP